MVEASSPILVVGMHRSGTSMVAGAIATLVGDDVPAVPRPGNPHGQFERLDLRAHLDLLLLSKRSTWMAPDISAGWPDSIGRKVVVAAAIRRLGEGTRVWKDPRLTITLPLWLAAIPHARVVLVHRHPSQVARSLFLRDGRPVDEGLELWAAYVHAALSALGGHEVFITRHDAISADPSSFVREVADWLGISSPELEHRALATIVATDVDESAPAPLSDELEQLWEEICGMNGRTALPAHSLRRPMLLDFERPGLLDLAAVGARSIARLVRGWP